MASPTKSAKARHDVYNIGCGIVQARYDGLGIIAHIRSQRTSHSLKSVNGRPKADLGGEITSEWLEVACGMFAA
jgi:hypothetical protein